MPDVTVIIPTINRKHLVDDAIQSVIDQTYEDWKVIVVDNGSTDGSYDYLRVKYAEDNRILIYQEIKKGCHHARNKALDNIQTEYVAFLDDDDIYVPEMLETQMNEIKKSADIGLVYGKVSVVDENGVETSQLPPQPSHNFEDLVKRSCLFPSTAVMRRDCIEKTGRFRDDLSTCTDFDFMLRFAHKHSIKFVNKVMALHRRHDVNLTNNRARLFVNENRVRKDTLKLGLTDEQKQYVKDVIREKAEEYEDEARRYMWQGNYGDARQIYKALFRHNPMIGMDIKRGQFRNPVYWTLRPYFAYALCKIKALKHGDRREAVHA